MKRYTARYRVLDDTLDIVQIKQAIESELLRAPVTFRRGAVTPPQDGIVLVEIASDAKQADLARILKGVESTRRLQLDSLGWGWPITDSKIATKINYRDSDPYLSMPAQAEPVHVYNCNVSQIAIRQSIGGLFLIGFVAGLVLTAFKRVDVFYWNILVIFLYMGWFFSGASLNPWILGAYAASIQCDQDGIRVKYWLRSIPKQWLWSQIERLELYSLYPNYTCTLRSGRESFRFSIVGLDQRHMLIRTIVERASLHFVEGTIGQTVYKRFDAE